MAAGAAVGFLRRIFEGCISASFSGIDRRPYHRDCKCALHCRRPRQRCSPPSAVSYPVHHRRCHGHGLRLATSSLSSHCQHHRRACGEAPPKLESTAKSIQLDQVDQLGRVDHVLPVTWLN
ncbi:uncharacterized protein LOC122043710 [Zingiber officinale]|uniref:Uncharacterized protein n=1 Tax=Zingiber officinale TaxID=94328 RepID=A0A8J5I3L8_ZINOF|nr:uncharacterized protein LOC122043710 [Zingiber officinale]KAG6527946.1 hypothetical protein ZIOFF_010081 [Zingiber officinale]